MLANNPVVIDNETYDQLGINLAVTYRVTGNGTGDASVAMRIVPSRIDQDGNVITADEAAMGISVASLDGVDQDAVTAVDAVKAAIEAYLAAKGI
jgi:predicted pyridoxine 5'-phosphate oxidase superfamily flavin-nucleotide-binding protein